MTKRLKIFLVSFALSVFFGFGINVFASSLEEFWFLQKLSNNPEILSAQIIQAVQINLSQGKQQEIKKLESVKFLVDDLKIGTKAVFSIKINNNGKEIILFEKNSQKVLPIASLTKLMTALLIFDMDETYDFSAFISITEKAVKQEGVSKYGELKQGELFSIETLVNIMLIESSNDVAYGLTEIVDKNENKKGFVELMNLYSEKIGLEHTYFVNPTGLEQDDLENPFNFSTAQDIVKLAKYILNEYPQIFKITTKMSYEVFDFNENLHHFIPKNTNQLLNEIDNIIGGKTGWSPQAGGCLLLITENSEDNSYIINVILGADNRFEEMRKLIKLTNY